MLDVPCDVLRLQLSIKAWQKMVIIILAIDIFDISIAMFLRDLCLCLKLSRLLLARSAVMLWPDPDTIYYSDPLLCFIIEVAPWVADTENLFSVRHRPVVLPRFTQCILFSNWQAQRRSNINEKTDMNFWLFRKPLCNLKHSSAEFRQLSSHGFLALWLRFLYLPYLKKNISFFTKTTKAFIEIP